MASQLVCTTKRVASFSGICAGRWHRTLGFDLSQNGYEGHSLNEWPEGSQDHTPRLVPEGYLGTLITQDQRLEGVWPT